MALRKIESPLFPPRRWSLAGHPGAGKSTFATTMRTPQVIIDADHRYSEMVWLYNIEAYDLGIQAGAYHDAGLVLAATEAAVGKVQIGTVIVDSLTAIIAPRVAKAIMDKDTGRSDNLAAGMVDKAMAMRLLQSAVSMWGADSLWIYHLNKGGDHLGNKIIKVSIPKTEVANLWFSLNLTLEASVTNKGRTISVTRSRYGRLATLLDTSGAWEHMPRRIEIAVYAPREFKSPEHSAEFAVQAEVIADLAIARALYAEVKAQAKPQNAIEMATAWREALDQYLVSGVPETLVKPQETEEAPDGTKE